MQALLLEPASHSLMGLLRDLELNRMACLPLHHGGAGSYPPIKGYVVDPKRDEVTGSQLAVEGQVEQGQIPDLMSDLEPHSNGPDLLRLERRLGSDQLAVVPRCGGSVRMAIDSVLHCSAPEAKPPSAMNLGRSWQQETRPYPSRIFVSIVGLARRSFLLADLFL
jgi:hypothetical protein